MNFNAAMVMMSAIALTACNPMANLSESETQIAEFETAYSRGNVEAMWAQTGSQLRKVTSREQFVDLNEVISSRLGKVVSSKRMNFKVNTNNGVTQTVIVMDTKFEQGQGIQTYTFLGHGEEMELVGWNVESPRLAYTAEDLPRK